MGQSKMDNPEKLIIGLNMYSKGNVPVVLLMFNQER